MQTPAIVMGKASCGVAARIGNALRGVAMRLAPLAATAAHAAIATAYCLLLTAYCLLLTDYRPPLATRHSPLTTHHAPRTTHCLLSACSRLSLAVYLVIVALLSAGRTNKAQHQVSACWRAEVVHRTVLAAAERRSCRVLKNSRPPIASVALDPTNLTAGKSRRVSPSGPVAQARRATGKSPQGADLDGRPFSLRQEPNRKPPVGRRPGPQGNKETAALAALPKRVAAVVAPRVRPAGSCDAKRA